MVVFPTTMAVDKSAIRKLLKQFSEHTEDPTQFLTNQPAIQSQFKILVKQCYDNSKSLEDQSAAPTFTLPKLLVSNFDAEQIWQQVELQNTFVCDELDKKIKILISDLESAEVIGNDVSRLNQEEPVSDISGDKEKKTVSKNVRFAVPSGSDDESEKNENSEDEINDGEDSENEDSDNDSELENEDDDDESLEPDDSDDVDDDEDNEKIAQSKKDLMNRKKNHMSDDSGDDDKETKSSFEERQQRLKQHMEKLEDDLLAEKPWHLKGEITAKKRPEDSLLNQVLEFDISSRPAPIITEEAALKLEDVIKNRIINKVWDDVERKVKPVDTPREFKKKLVLDQEKSKLSLAQVYEQDYLKQREAVEVNNKNEKEEPKEHKQIRVLLNSLFRKLDALSNYHYTPLPSIPEPQIVTNLPAVTLEEAVPDAISTATLLAPEEIQGKTKGDFVSKEERTTTDKKRARRKKKIKQRLKNKRIKSKENELKKLGSGIKNNFAKEKVKKDLERLCKDKSISHFQEDTSGKPSKSSQQFFARLQDTISKESDVKKRKRESVNIDPKRIKL